MHKICDCCEQSFPQGTVVWMLRFKEPELADLRFNFCSFECQQMFRVEADVLFKLKGAANDT